MRALWKLARRQLGLITRAQALQLVTIDELRTQIDNGTLVQRRRGVWALAGAPETYEQAVLAAILAIGEDAWASHRTAARLWGLKVPAPDAIDVLTMPHERHRLDGVAQHRNKLVVAGDVTLTGAIPVTSIARTLLDCSPWLPGRSLGRAVDDARRRGLLRTEDLMAAHAAVDEGARTGRHLVRPMRKVLSDRHHAGGSERELNVLRILRKAGLPLPVQQFPIVIGGRQRYLDYAYPVEKVFLEWDGFSEHGLLREVFDDDRDRDAELHLTGWLGLHFTSNTTPADLVSRVERALALRAA
jgi:very-short-patch-repair endonuclease